MASLLLQSCNPPSGWVATLCRTPPPPVVCFNYSLYRTHTCVGHSFGHPISVAKGGMPTTTRQIASRNKNLPGLGRRFPGVCQLHLQRVFVQHNLATSATRRLECMLLHCFRHSVVGLVGGWAALYCKALFVLVLVLGTGRRLVRMRAWLHCYVFQHGMLFS